MNLRGDHLSHSEARQSLRSLLRNVSLPVSPVTTSHVPAVATAAFMHLPLPFMPILHTASLWRLLKVAYFYYGISSLDDKHETTSHAPIYNAQAWPNVSRCICYHEPRCSLYSLCVCWQHMFTRDTSTINLYINTLTERKHRLQLPLQPQLPPLLGTRSSQTSKKYRKV